MKENSLFISRRSPPQQINIFSFDLAESTAAFTLADALKSGVVAPYRKGEGHPTGGATAAAIADGKAGALFGRGGGFFNRGFVRFGWSWEGSAETGKDVIRLAIGAARGTSWWSHIPFWYP
jgi:hypothetical protein